MEAQLYIRLKSISPESENITAHRAFNNLQRFIIAKGYINWADLAQVGWTSVLPELTFGFRDYINHFCSVISSLVNYYG
jgi:hypothetical protein